MKHYILARLTLYTILMVWLAIATGCSTQDEMVVASSPYPLSDDTFLIETIADGFSVPYGIAVVDDEEYLFTDRVGKLYHYKDNSLTEILNMPMITTFIDPGFPEVLHGGMMDVSIHPDYASNSWVYISYLSIDGIARVTRFKLQGSFATSIETLFQTRSTNFYGNGMRIEWEDDSHFFLNVGGATFSNNSDPTLVAQDLNEDAGKIHRLMDDGSIPIDNPLWDGYTTPISVWSYGHRDVQGLFYDVSDNTLFGVEHGPNGGDEFNVIEKGANFGWPLFTYGINYDGTAVSTISEDSAATFTVLPEHYWTVQTNDGGMAITPACLLMVNDSNIEDWNGYFLVGSLAYERLLKYNRDTDETFNLELEGRIRTIRQLPGGDIIAAIERTDTDKTDGKIVRISN